MFTFYFVFYFLFCRILFLIYSKVLLTFSSFLFIFFTSNFLQISLILYCSKEGIRTYLRWKLIVYILWLQSMEFVRAFMSSGRKEQVRKYKEYGDLREKGEREQRVLWTKRNRRENTRSMVIWDTRVRENKVYYDLR